MKILPQHPRAESIRIREEIVKHCGSGAVVLAGLIAHGRGEAFDYLLGEKTTENAFKAIRSAASVLLLAKHSVISVNGNVAALASKDIVKLANTVGSKIEVNLFYQSEKREKAIKQILKESGAKEILGLGEAASANIPEVHSDRRRVDSRGILKADVVLVPLEDGDRTEALVKMGKTVIAIDLNPLSRTAQWASITIVDNVIRAMPILIEEAKKIKNEKPKNLQKLAYEFNNSGNLGKAIGLMTHRLSELAEKGIYIPEVTEIHDHLEKRTFSLEEDTD